MPATFTTTLPDENQPQLGNGVEDEVAVERETTVSNYGSVRIQIRETGAASWDSAAAGFGEFLGAYDTLSMAFVGREDGEEYEVRARTETEHRTGAWTSPVSIITQFPGAANLQLDPNASVTETSVPLVWTDQSDNEDGFDVERRRLYESGWSDWQPIATEGPNTESYVDETVLPGQDYEFRIRAYTEHTSATSATVAVSTPDLEAEAKRIPASGWYVEVEHPGAGTPLRPRVVGSPQKNPTVNGLPELRIPVPKSDKWNDDGFEDATLRVWEDGIRQPVDELVRREQQPDQTVLVGEGGTELRQSVQRDVVEQEADNFVRELVPEETSYAVNVDEPTGTREEDVPQASVDTQSDYEALLASMPAADEPARITSDGFVEETRTLDIHFAEITPTESRALQYYDNTDLVSTLAEQDSDRWINDTVYEVANGSGQTGEVWASGIGLEHDIPAGEVGVAVRLQGPVDQHVQFEIRVDETTVSEVTTYTLRTNESEPSWFEVFDTDVLGELAAGSHEIRFVPTSEPSGENALYINGMALYDRRNYSGLNTAVSGGQAVGPRTHNADYVAEFSDVTPTKSVVGGRVSVSMSSTQGNQALGVSNDSGATWRTSSNTSEFATDWTDPSATLRARVQLSSHDTSTGFNFTEQTGHRLDILDLAADLQDIPVLVNEAYDDLLVNVLNTVADDTNSVWCLVPDGTGGYSLEWTQPGQRPTEIDTDVLDYTHSEDTSERVEKARVFGSSREYSETITAQHDAEVALTHSPLVDASERVEDPSTGTVYEYGADYIPRGNAGTIEALSTGDISDGQSLRVTYEYSLSSSYTAADAGSDPREQRFDFNIPTERGCGQAARYLVQELKDPVVEAQLVIPKAPLGWEVVNAINPDVIPGSPKQIRSMEQSPEQVSVQLENRESVGEVVDDLRQQATSNTRQV